MNTQHEHTVTEDSDAADDVSPLFDEIVGEDQLRGADLEQAAEKEAAEEEGAAELESSTEPSQEKATAAVVEEVESLQCEI